MDLISSGMSKVLFPAPAPSYTIEGLADDLVWVPKRTFSKDARTCETSDDDAAIPCLLLKSDSAEHFIIYFHCNAEDIGVCRSFCDYLRNQFKVHVLAVEYPGYGLCGGTPSCESVMDNALSALHFVKDDLGWPLQSINIFGRSIGTGPAVALAGLYDIGGLILVAPFLSIQDLLTDYLGNLVGLVGDAFEDAFVNKDIAPRITCATLVVHGKADTVIAHEHGREFFSLLKSTKIFSAPDNMTHNSSVLANLKHLILPMFKLFHLSEVTCRRLEIPHWAKRKMDCIQRIQRQRVLRSLQSKCEASDAVDGLSSADQQAKLRSVSRSTTASSEDFQAHSPVVFSISFAQKRCKKKSAGCCAAEFLGCGAKAFIFQNEQAVDEAPSSIIRVTKLAL